MMERDETVVKTRHEYAIDLISSQLEVFGLSIAGEDGQSVWFDWKGHQVRHWSYTGWHSGKTIKDGRGIHRLIDQLK